jgi:hypothetical protein
MLFVFIPAGRKYFFRGFIKMINHKKIYAKKRFSVGAAKSRTPFIPSFFIFQVTVWV